MFVTNGEAPGRLCLLYRQCAYDGHGVIHFGYPKTTTTGVCMLQGTYVCYR
jgi:hypothetical protein